MSPSDRYDLVAILPSIFPEWLGDRSFCEEMSIRFPYLSGAMANGIATTTLVQSMARQGFMGFFGAAGLSVQRVEEAIDELSFTLGDLPWGSNLIHSPNEPELEQEIADLYIRRNVRYVSAAAYMKLTLPVVQYALTGLYVDSQGRIQRRNRLFAKISRPEVALHFMQPAPDAMVQKLLQQGKITQEEAELAKHVAVAECYTVEADSGGHTDNQSLTALFPTIQKSKKRCIAEIQLPKTYIFGCCRWNWYPTICFRSICTGCCLCRYWIHQPRCRVRPS